MKRFRSGHSGMGRWIARHWLDAAIVVLFLSGIVLIIAAFLRSHTVGIDRVL